MKLGKAVASAAAVGVMSTGLVGCSLSGKQAADTAKAVKQEAADTADAMLAALTKASDAASQAGSAEVKMTVSMAETGGRPTVMTGVYSWGNGVAMEAELPAKDVQMEELVKDGTVTYRLVQGAYYYQVDRAESGPFEGKTWLKVDASAVLGDKGAAAMNGPNNDPTAGLKTLKWAKGVNKVGKEDVNGKPSVHYKATIPVEKLDKQTAGAAYEALGGAGTELVTDVWVDEKGMPARLSQVFGSTAISMDFLSFGAAKEIAAPPAAETADITAAFKEANKAQG
ncbi:hypothetical protein AB0D45_00965 [Streptomyces sp. NPDC048352]|uniref:hypothetical protein n=1 Tax=Streptomyces sp. NPDC048352 TaxID=3154718 RepID=UPI00343A34CA